MDAWRTAAFLALVLSSALGLAEDNSGFSTQDEKIQLRTDAIKRYKESTQSLGKLGVYNRLQLLAPNAPDSNRAPIVDSSISWLFPAMNWSLSDQRDNEVEAQDGDVVGNVPGLKKGLNQILEYLVEIDECPNFPIDKAKLEEWRRTRPKNLKIAYADDSEENSPGSPRILKSLEDKDELYFKALEIYKLAKENIQKLKEDEVNEVELSIALQKFTTATIDKDKIERSLVTKEINPRIPSSHEKTQNQFLHSEGKKVTENSHRAPQEI